MLSGFKFNITFEKYPWTHKFTLDFTVTVLAYYFQCPRITKFVGNFIISSRCSLCLGGK